MRRWAAVLMLCLGSWCFAISYTVQVAAVSDQDGALSLVRLLLRDGYPAYFVRTTTEAGFVFRIRVGAFQNRAAAVRYADAMPTVAGSRPVPALAEAIPTGIMPLAPALLLSAQVDDDARAELIAWGNGVAFRSQATDPLEEATYAVLGTADATTFAAWRASLQDDGTVIRVRNAPLWPGEGNDDAPEVRAEFAAQVRRLIAQQLGVESTVVDEAVVTTAAGVPALIVVERFRPGVPDSGTLIGLADPGSGFGPDGPTEFLLGGELVPPAAEPLVRLDTIGGTQADAAALAGEGWSAAADAGFTRLATADASWRAVAGTPQWAAGDLLVALDGTTALVYRFEARALESAE